MSSGLDHSWWAGQLGVLLIGKAQVAYQAMPWGEAMDYDKVKKEITYRLDINPERYQQAFHMKKKEDKSPQILLQHLTPGHHEMILNIMD